MAKKRRQFSGTSTDYREQYLAPIAERPKKGRVGRFFGRVVLISISIMAVGNAILFIVLVPSFYSTTNSLRADQEEINLPQHRVRHDALGEQVVQLWFSQEATKPPVSLAPDIIWQNGIVDTGGGDDPNNFVMTTVTFLSGDMREGREDSYIESLDYLAQINGDAYVISLSFLVPDLENYHELPVLIAEPTLRPVMNSTNPELAELAEPTDLNAVDENQENIRARAQEWAQAWTTNNASAIKGVTGDNSNNSYYAGMFPQDWRFVADSLEVNWAYYLPGTQDEAYLQVSWLVETPRTVGLDEDGEEITIDGRQIRQTMEILIQDPQSGLPYITAWGPAGSYESLEPYMNALTEEEFNSVTSENGTGGDDEEEDPEPTEIIEDEDDEPEAPDPSPSDDDEDDD